MNENFYRCESCTKKFSRKWNANRHIDNVHGGKGIAFNVYTGSISRDELNYAGNAFDSTLLPSGLEHINNLQTTNSSTLSEYLEEEDKRILAVVDKMVPPFEELEKLLINEPENERMNILNNVIVFSLNSPNPVKYMQDSVNFYRSAIGMNKMVEHVAKRNNVSLNQARTYFRTMIKNGAYFKNQLSFTNKKQ